MIIERLSTIAKKIQPQLLLLKLCKMNKERYDQSNLYEKLKWHKKSLKYDSQGKVFSFAE